jgi:nicotinate-nucleotide adenylyltransferase
MTDSAPSASLAVPPEAQGLLVFGGSFDPPHRWHPKVAREVRDRVMPAGSWIVVIPAARSPLKDARPRASDEDRVAMLGRAFEGVPKTAIWGDELQRSAWAHAQHQRGGPAPGPSYTVETLERLRTVVGPTMPMRLLIGADQAARFHEWREPKRIQAIAEPVVVLRPPIETTLQFRRTLEQTGAWSEPEIDAWTRRICEVQMWAISSTQLRAWLAGRASGSGSADAQAAEEAIDPRVLGYIEARGLYRI